MFDQRIIKFLNSACNQGSTPFYLIDLDQIINSLNSFIQEWEKKFKHFRVAYSYKSNSLKAITQGFAKQGISAEVVSGCELKWALEDGFKPQDIFFDGPLKTKQELEFAVQNHVNIQVDSLDELKILIAVYDYMNIRPHISLRLSTTYRNTKKSRFGFIKEEVLLAQKLLINHGIDLKGIHIHLGSNLTDSTLGFHELKHYEDLILPIIKATHKPFWIDIGGGYPAKSVSKTGSITPLSAFVNHVEAFFKEHHLFDKNIELITEPGRCLVEDHGYLLTSVHVKKKREDRQLLIVDAGIHLVKSIGSWHHPIILLNEKSSNDNQKLLFDVCGSNCFESDLFIKDLEVNQGVEIGDYIAIGSSGGYDIPSSNAWIRPLPAIYGILNDEIVLIRQPQDPDEVRINQVNLEECSLKFLENAKMFS